MNCLLPKAMEIFKRNLRIFYVKNIVSAKWKTRLFLPLNGHWLETQWNLIYLWKLAIVHINCIKEFLGIAQNKMKAMVLKDCHIIAVLWEVQIGNTKCWKYLEMAKCKIWKKFGIEISVSQHAAELQFIYVQRSMPVKKRKEITMMDRNSPNALLCYK